MRHQYVNTVEMSSNSIQLMPALKVNIIIVHPRGVVFPEGFSPRENNIPRVNNYDVHASAGINCFIILKLDAKNF